jgi:hypothetical protein
MAEIPDWYLLTRNVTFLRNVKHDSKPTYIQDILPSLFAGSLGRKRAGHYGRPLKSMANGRKEKARERERERGK